MSRNSITPSRAFLTIAVSVRIVWPSAAGSAQLACGLGGPGATSTRHMRQLPAMLQPLVIAEARDFLPRKLARLQHGRALRDLELDAVDGDLRHCTILASLPLRARASQRS